MIRTLEPGLRLAVALCAAAALPAAAQTGRISGTVTATPAKYLSETVVYVIKAPGAFPPKTVDLDQKALAFAPHVLVVTQGDTVRFQNHDTVAHNVYSPDGSPYNLGTFKPSEERTRRFDEPGAYSQLCSIHPEMLSYVYVSQNPYAAAVDAKGRYAIQNVPSGTYQLAVWNAHLRAPAKPVTVAPGGAAEVGFELAR